MLFYYIRHGDPVYNPDSLTPFGHEQAEALSKRFVKLGFDRIYTSDSMRAQMTAAPTAQKLGITPTVVPWANESRPYERMCAFFENGNREYIFDHPVTKAQFVSKEVRDLADDWATHDAFKNETYGACLEEIRCDMEAFFESLGYRHDRERFGFEAINPTEERVALFAHQAFGLAFLSCVMDVPYPLFSTRFDMGHTGVTVIEFAARDGFVVPRMLQMSNDSHLYHEGLSTKYQNRIEL